MVSPFVSATWLRHRLLDGLKNLRVVDGTWHGPSAKTNAKKDFERQRIENAVFFDIDEVSDKKTDLPHMLPSPEEFAEYVAKLGITNDHHIIVYDNHPEYGVFSSPRVWWTFRAFGHADVSVLDGGLRKWISHGYPTVAGPAPVPISVPYKATYQPQIVRTMRQMLDNLNTHAEQVVDVRSKARFDGTAPEPRAGLLSGHMVGAINIPFSKLLNPETGLVAPKHQIQEGYCRNTVLDSPFVWSIMTEEGERKEERVSDHSVLLPLPKRPKKNDEEEAKAKQESIAKMKKANADMMNIEITLSDCRARVRNAEDNVKNAKDTVEKAEANLKTLKSAQEDLDASQNTLRRAQEDLESAQEDLDASQNTLKSAKKGLHASQRTLTPKLESARKCYRESLEEAKPVMEADWTEFLCQVEHCGKYPPEFPNLTHHEQYRYNDQETAILGEDRLGYIETIVKNISDLTKSPINNAKESHPIYCAISSPRQGKSLLLDVVCSNIRERTNVLAIAISYNSNTKFSFANGDSCEVTCASRFWGRVIHALTQIILRAEVSWLGFLEHSFVPLFNMLKVLEFTAKFFSQYVGGSIVIAADEFSHVLVDLDYNMSIEDRKKVLSSITTNLYSTPYSALIFSGFDTMSPLLLETASDRPSKIHVLQPSTKEYRSEYDPMKKLFESTFNPFPIALYEWTKFSPGLLGLCIENKEALRQEGPTIGNLNPPIVGEVATKVRKGSHFYRKYWEECFNLKRNYLLDLPCLKYYQSHNVLIHTKSKKGLDLEGFINPFLLIHGHIRSSYPDEEKEIFAALEDAFCTTPWDKNAKGDALEKVVVSALALRQLHTGNTMFQFEKVASALCGKKQCGSYPQDWKSLCVRFRKTVATGVESFPCHYASPSNKGDGTIIKGFCNDETQKEQRRKAAIDAIKNHGIIYPTSTMNPGCDIILVVDLFGSDGKNKGCALVIFETKYHDRDTYLGDNEPSQKACLVLEGLLAKPNPLDTCNVRHVFFTLCLSNKGNISYDPSFQTKRSLSQYIEELSARCISVSLHSVNKEEHWMNLVTPSLYYAIPDVDENTVESG